ncbi:hypothetical protein D3C80_2109750 [compost metagenome]
MQLDGRLCAERRYQFPDDDLAFLEPLRVDIHQRNPCTRQGRALQHVADDVLHEHGRAGADEGDLWLSRHEMPLFC